MGLTVWNLQGLNDCQPLQGYFTMLLNRAWFKSLPEKHRDYFSQAIIGRFTFTACYNVTITMKRAIVVATAIMIFQIQYEVLLQVTIMSSHQMVETVTSSKNVFERTM